MKNSFKNLNSSVKNERNPMLSFSKAAGLSFVICIKSGNSPTYDCVVCNQDKAVSFSLLEIANHVHSYSHALNVMMVENSLLYDKYKDENSQSTELIIEELVKHEEKCQVTQKVSFATEETFSSVRSSVINRIKQSLSSQNKKTSMDEKNHSIVGKFKSTLTEIPPCYAGSKIAKSENKFHDIMISNSEKETSLSKDDIFKFNVDKMLMGSKTSEDKYLQYKMLADAHVNKTCDPKISDIKQDTSSDVVSNLKSTKTSEEKHHQYKRLADVHINKTWDTNVSDFKCAISSNVISDFKSTTIKKDEYEEQLIMPAVWDQKPMLYLKTQLERFSAVYAKDLIRIKKMQKSRIQTNIVIVTDERDEYDKNLADFNEKVTVLKVPGINLKYAFSCIQKDANYGKGTLYVFSCGIHNVLISSILEDCRMCGCPTPQTMLNCAPVENYSIIGDALKLNFDILFSTTNDIAIFCGLIPVDIVTYNTFTYMSRPCRVAHQAFKTSVILPSSIKSCLTAIELYNGFTKYHAHNMGFTPWSVEDSFFDVNSGTNEYERGFIQSKMYVNGYILSSEENIFKANKAKLLCTELLSSFLLKIKIEGANIAKAHAVMQKDDIDPSFLYNPLEISETITEAQTSIISQDHQCDKIVVIADKAYRIWLQDFKKYEHVTILADEELSIYNFEKYMIEKKKALSTNTLYLLVVGIYSITTSVNASICESSKCSFPLQALTPLCQSIDMGVIKKFVKFQLQKINDILNNVQSILPHNSKVVIMPPIPIAVLPSNDGHEALHMIKPQFPEYVIINKISGLQNLYPLWMEEMSSISRKSIIRSLGMDERITGILKNFKIASDQDLTKMKCKHKFDKPSYVLWKHVICDFLKAVFFSSKMKLDPIAISNIPIPKETKQNSNFKEKIELTVSNLDCGKSLNTKENCSQYDCIVFIGHMRSKLLLPEVIFGYHLYWKFDDLDVASITTNVAALRKNGAKKILFIFIGDIPMMLTELQDQQCIKKNCKTQLFYFNILPSLATKMKETIDSVKKIIGSLKNHCALQFSCIMAPLLPRNCVHIPNLLYIHQFHKVIHDYKESISYSNFFIGNSCEKSIFQILLDFETEWKVLSLFVQKDIPMNPSEIENFTKFSGHYATSKDHAFHWNAMCVPPVGAIDDSSSALIKWQECILTVVSNVEMNRPKIKESIISDSQSSSDCGHRVHIASNENTASNTIQNDDNIGFCTDEKSRIENYHNVNNVILCHNKGAKVVLKLLNDIEIAKEGCKSYRDVDTLFNNVFIVGKKELISPLSKLNIRASIVSHNLANIEVNDVKCILYKMGKLTRNSLCCLVFDLSVIMKKLPISSECCKFLCQKPLSIISFKNESPNLCRTLEEVETIISNQLQNVNQFVKKLSKHVPVIILPLFPTKIFENDSSQIACHEISHKICEMGFYVTNKDNLLWNQSMKALTFAWNGLLENNHENYDSYNYITNFISSEPNSFIFLKNIEDFKAKWNEVNLWIAFVETLLLSLVPAKFPNYGYSLNFKLDKEEKTNVYIMQISPSVPHEFFEELFSMLDPNATFEKVDEDKGIMGNIRKDKAKLIVAKLNNYLIGDSFLQVFTSDSDECDISKFTLVQQMNISSILEILDDCWKKVIVKNLSAEINEVPDITNIKTNPCEGGISCKGLKVCLKYHNLSDRRRNPLLFKYNSRYCTRPKKKDELGLCLGGVTCGYSHNKYELNFLPIKYQATVCPSLATADICNLKGLCHFAHRDSAELFFTSEFKDLLLFGTHNTFKYFAGAIRAVYKMGSIGICEARIILMSSSAELIDLVMKVSADLIKAFNLKVLTLGKENISEDYENYEIFVGHPSEFFELKHEIILSNAKGAILVDSVQTLLESDTQEEKLTLFFQRLRSSSNYKFFNKVFISPSYNSKLLGSLSHATGLTLTELQEPVCNDLQKRNSLGSSSASNSTSRWKTKDVKIIKDPAVRSTPNKALSNSQNSPRAVELELNACSQTESNLGKTPLLRKNQSRSSKQDIRSLGSKEGNTDWKMDKKISPLEPPSSKSMLNMIESLSSIAELALAKENKNRLQFQSMETSNTSKLKNYEKSEESISRKARWKRSRNRDHKRSRSRSNNRDKSSSFGKRRKSRSKSSDRKKSLSPSSERKRSISKSQSGMLAESGSMEHTDRPGRSKSKNRPTFEICGVSNSLSSLESRSNFHVSTSKPENSGISEGLKPKDNYEAVSDSPSCELRTQSKNHILCAKLGQDLFGQYLEEESSLQKQFDKEFLVYKSVPHLHPKYKKYYETFSNYYAVQHDGKDENLKQNMWNLFWISKFDDIKAEEYKEKMDFLLKKYEDQAVTRASILPSDSSQTEVEKSFVYDEGLSLLEKLCASIGMFGPGLKSIIKECRVLGTTTSEAYRLFGNKENEVLINMVLEKCKQLSISATGESLQMFQKVIEYIPKLLHEAKLGLQQNDQSVSLDLNAIAKASHGKGSEFTYDLIKTVLAYEGITNATTEYVNDLFLKVCKIHFSLSYKE